MNRIEEIQREIESVRSELNESFLQNDEFEEYYRKSTELDKLIEEYLERKQQVQNELTEQANRKNIILRTIGQRILPFLFLCNKLVTLPQKAVGKSRKFLIFLKSGLRCI